MRIGFAYCSMRLVHSRTKPRKETVMQDALRGVTGSTFASHGSSLVLATMPGVYVLPRMLTDAQIRELVGLNEVKCHHDDDGHGHNRIGHDDSSEECEKEEEERGTPEEDADNAKRRKADLYYFRAHKPHRLPWMAELIYKHIPEIRVGSLCPVGVDENMQLYRLQEGRGAVPHHRDKDFNGPDGSRALCSILVYLNNGYVGGETVFNSVMPAPRVEVGGGLLFRHDILHGGLAVLRGEKYVLKTDLLFRRR